MTVKKNDKMYLILSKQITLASFESTQSQTHDHKCQTDHVLPMIQYSLRLAVIKIPP